MQNTRAATKVLVAAIALAIVVGVGRTFLFRRSQPSSSRSAHIPTNEQTTAKLPVATDKGGLSPEIAAAAQLLSQTSRAEGSIACLTKLRIRLNELGSTMASAAVRHALDAGMDTQTRLGFKLGSDGGLVEAPSLRVFLLDYLTQVDPRAAAGAADKILRSSSSPDEWAAALRAYALGNDSPETKSFLQQKTRELLRNDAWRTQPSVGFLEAFDVVVYTRDHELTPELASWVRQTDNRALRHAAYLTLDRTIQEAPVETLNQLQTQPDLLTGREATRAGFFARADVRDAQQREVLERYLMDPRRSEVEWKAFAAIYPNANYMVSHNLLTQTRTPGGEEIAARDHAALKVTQEWLADPRFAQFNTHLQTIQGRLEQFVNPGAARR